MDKWPKKGQLITILQFLTRNQPTTKQFCDFSVVEKKNVFNYKSLTGGRGGGFHALVVKTSRIVNDRHPNEVSGRW